MNWHSRIFFFLITWGNTSWFYLFWKLGAQKFIGTEKFPRLQFINCFLYGFHLLLLQVRLWYHSSGRTKVLVASSLSGCCGAITCEDLYSRCTSPWCWLHSWPVPPLLPRSEGCVRPSAITDRNLLRGIDYLNCSVFQAHPCDSWLYPGPHPMEAGI